MMMKCATAFVLFAMFMAMTCLCHGLETERDGLSAGAGNNWDLGEDAAVSSIIRMRNNMLHSHGGHVLIDVKLLAGAVS